MKILTEKELLNINGGAKKTKTVSSTSASSYSWGASSSNKSKICRGSGNSSRCRKS